MSTLNSQFIFELLFIHLFNFHLWLSAANENERKSQKSKFGNSHEFLENGKVGDSYTRFSFVLSLLLMGVAAAVLKTGSECF